MSISKIKINDIEYNLIASNTAYGTCATAAATAAKVITTSSPAEWVLTPGARITIKFTYTNSASNPTFNVNGTGAKSVWYGTGILTTANKGYAGTANRPMDFIYDGTQYVFMGWSYDANTTYTNASLGQGYGTCDTAATTTAKVVTLSSYALTTGGIVAVKFTYDVPAAATMNINSKGAKAIYYKGVAITDGVIKAGNVATFIYNGTQYHLLAIDDDTKYVKTTDYATTKTAGIVKVGAGLTIMDGAVQVYPATNRAIDGKVNVEPITPQFLDYAIKSGITTNTIELTDEEKTSAREWLGTVDTDYVNNAIAQKSQVQFITWEADD